MKRINEGARSMKNNKKNHIITSRFDDVRYEEILKKASEMGISISGLINIAVSEYLQKK